MPKIVHNQTNFSAGEITPRMLGRIDVARYANGAELIENGIVSIHGGVVRRSGTRFLAQTKHGGAYKSRLFTYVFNVEQSYCLEFGHGYVRVFDGSTGAVILDDSLVPLEVASPYTEAQLPEITAKQSADVMFLYHPEVAPQQLRRLSPTRWVLSPVPWGVMPFSENGHEPNAKLTLSAATVGAGRTFTTVNVTVPDAPTAVAASALNGGATVTFTPPANNGGGAITHYTVTSSPGSITATGSGSPIVVPGLANGTSYTFTVTATNAAGTSAPSVASNATTPDAGAPTGSLGVTASPSSFATTVPNGSVLEIWAPTATVTGAVGAVSFVWTRLSGNGVAVVSANTAQVSVTSNNYSATNYATLRCTARDAIGQIGTVDVTLAITHSASAGGSGGSGGGYYGDEDSPVRSEL